MSSPRRVELLLFDPSQPEHLVAHPDDGDPAELLPLVTRVLELAAERERWANLPPFFVSARTDAGRQLVARHDGKLLRCWLVTDALYRDVNDPWKIAERFPIDAGRRGPISAEEWPLDEPPAPRRLADLDAVLREGEGPTLLGAAQCLADGGRFAETRPEPEAFFRRLWALLPTATRQASALTTFADADRKAFALFAPESWPEDGVPGVSDPVRAENYPEGRYEANLQYAVEHGDEREVQRLLARRTPHQTARLALVMIVGMVGLTLLGRFLRKLGG